jgi:hypothetical protein
METNAQNQYCVNSREYAPFIPGDGALLLKVIEEMQYRERSVISKVFILGEFRSLFSSNRLTFQFDPVIELKGESLC